MFAQVEFKPSITPFAGAAIGYNTPCHHPSWGHATTVKGIVGLSLEYKHGQAYIMFGVGPKKVDQGKSLYDYRNYVYMFYSTSIGYEFHLPRHWGVRIGGSLDNFNLIDPESVPDIMFGDDMWGIFCKGSELQDGRHFGIDIGVSYKIGDHIKIVIDYSVFNLDLRWHHPRSDHGTPYHYCAMNVNYEFHPIVLKKP